MQAGADKFQEKLHRVTPARFSCATQEYSTITAKHIKGFFYIILISNEIHRLNDFDIYDTKSEAHSR